MILKIRNEFSVEAWSIIGGITEISYGFKTKSELASHVDRHFDSLKDANDEEQLNWLQILVKFSNGKEEVWVTEVTTYLLNNLGKTIETIHS